MNSTSIVEELRNKLNTISSFRGLILFGSYAKNKQKKTSDIDVIITFENLPKSIYQRDLLINDLIMGLEDKYLIEINPILADDNNLGKTPLMLEISDYAKIIEDKNSNIAQLFNSINKDYEEGYVKKIQKKDFKIIQIQ